MDHPETTGTAAGESRRFARFVAAPRMRRIAPARIGLAGLTSLLILGALVVLLDLATDWLEARPAYQLPFRAIALEPPPPACYLGGAPAFLDRVRAAGGYPESVSVLGLDLERLRSDFRNYCWVHRVVKVERGYPNRLTVRLEYHRPVAVARCKAGAGGPGAEPDRVIDRDGRILPWEDIDWEACGPLVPISGLEPPTDPRPGLFWKSADSPDGPERPDPRVVGAARLADFLKATLERERPTAPDLQRPGIIPVRYAGKSPLFVQIGPATMFLWGDPPGDEAPGDLPAEAKWAMLRDRVETRPEPPMAPGDYLMFTRGGLIHHHATPPAAGNR